MLKYALSTVAVTMLVFATTSANASLIGDQINYEYLFPNTSSVFDQRFINVVAGNSDAVTSDLGTVDLTVNPEGDSIELLLTQTGTPPTFNPGTFNGARFSDLDWVGIPGEIIGVNLVTDFAGLTASRVSFTADSVSVNFVDLTMTQTTHFVSLQLETRHVPEPASMALFGLGAAGLGFVRRRNKKVVA